MWNMFASLKMVMVTELIHRFEKLAQDTHPCLAALWCHVLQTTPSPSLCHQASALLPLLEKGTLPDLTHLQICTLLSFAP